MDRSAEKGFGDDQGTRVGAPDRTVAPAEHSDTPPDRPERKTGAGREATVASPEGPDHEEGSGYGGKGGKPKNGSPTRAPSK
ncbi:MAG: hypothetical protein ACRDRL_18405 [Sciscionella sp.]